MAKTLNFKPLFFKMTLILSVVTGSSARQVNFHGLNDNSSSTSDVPQFSQRLISSQQQYKRTQQHQQSGQQDQFQQQLVRSLQDGQSEEQQKHVVHQKRGRFEDENESQQKQLDDGNESEERQQQALFDEDKYQQDQEESEDEDEYQQEQEGSEDDDKYEQGQEESEDDAETQQRQQESKDKDYLEVEEPEGEEDSEDESQQGQEESENEDESQDGQKESETEDESQQGQEESENEDEYQQQQEESEDDKKYKQGQEELEDDTESQQRQRKSEDKDDLEEQEGEGDSEDESQEGQKESENEDESQQGQEESENEDEYQQEQEESEEDEKYKKGQEELEDDTKSQQRKSENKDDLEEQEGEGDSEDESPQGQEESEIEDESQQGQEESEIEDESQQGQKESENDDEFQQGQGESEDIHGLEEEERRREGDNEQEFEEQEGEQEELEEVVPLTGSQSEQDTDTATTVLRAPFAEIPIEINGIAFNVTAVISQIDRGDLPAANVLRAIFSTPLKPGEDSTPLIQELKEYLLDQIVSDKELVIKALLLKEVSMVREIVDRIYIGKRSDESANPHDGSDVLNDNIPAADVIPIHQPKPGFSGKIRGSFRGGSKPELKIGDLGDNDKIPEDSVKHQGVGSGRSSVSPPVGGLSHLAPVATRASALKRYNFKPNNAGHPEIRKGRIITRMRKDQPLRRTDRRKIIAKHEENTLKDNKQRSNKLHQRRDFYQRNTNRKDLVDPPLAVSDPRLKSKMVLKRRSCTTVRCLKFISHQGSQDIGATMSI